MVDAKNLEPALRQRDANHTSATSEIKCGAFAVRRACDGVEIGLEEEPVVHAVHPSNVVIVRSGRLTVKLDVARREVVSHRWKIPQNTSQADARVDAFSGLSLLSRLSIAA